MSKLVSVTSILFFLVSGLQGALSETAALSPKEATRLYLRGINHTASSRPKSKSFRNRSSFISSFLELSKSSKSLVCIVDDYVGPGTLPVGLVAPVAYGVEHEEAYQFFGYFEPDNRLVTTMSSNKRFVLIENKDKQDCGLFDLERKVLVKRFQNYGDCTFSSNSKWLLYHKSENPYYKLICIDCYTGNQVVLNEGLVNFNNKYGRKLKVSFLDDNYVCMSSKQSYRVIEVATSKEVSGLNKDLFTGLLDDFHVRFAQIDHIEYDFFNNRALIYRVDDNDLFDISVLVDLLTGEELFSESNTAKCFMCGKNFIVCITQDQQLRIYDCKSNRWIEHDCRADNFKLVSYRNIDTKDQFEFDSVSGEWKRGVISAVVEEFMLKVDPLKFCYHDVERQHRYLFTFENAEGFKEVVLFEGGADEAQIQSLPDVSQLMMRCDGESDIRIEHCGEQYIVCSILGRVLFVNRKTGQSKSWWIVRNQKNIVVSSNEKYISVEDDNGVSWYWIEDVCQYGLDVDHRLTIPFHMHSYEFSCDGKYIVGILHDRKITEKKQQLLRENAMTTRRVGPRAISQEKTILDCERSDEYRLVILDAETGALASDERPECESFYWNKTGEYGSTRYRRDQYKCYHLFDMSNSGRTLFRRFIECEHGLPSFLKCDCESKKGLSELFENKEGQKLVTDWIRYQNDESSLLFSKRYDSSKKTWDVSDHKAKGIAAQDGNYSMTVNYSFDQYKSLAGVGCFFIDWSKEGELLEDPFDKTVAITSNGQCAVVQDKKYSYDTHMEPQDRAELVSKMKVPCLVSAISAENKDFQAKQFLYTLTSMLQNWLDYGERKKDHELLKVKWLASRQRENVLEDDLQQLYTDIDDCYFQSRKSRNNKEEMDSIVSFIANKLICSRNQAKELLQNPLCNQRMKMASDLFHQSKTVLSEWESDERAAIVQKIIEKEKDLKDQIYQRYKRENPIHFSQRSRAPRAPGLRYVDPKNL